MHISLWVFPKRDEALADIIIPFHNAFSLALSNLNKISSYVMTTNWRLYSKVSEIMLQYKTRGYYNKFDEIYGGILLTCQNTTMRLYGAWLKR